MKTPHSKAVTAITLGHHSAESANPAIAPERRLFAPRWATLANYGCTQNAHFRSARHNLSTAIQQRDNATGKAARVLSHCLQRSAGPRSPRSSDAHRCQWAPPTRGRHTLRPASCSAPRILSDAAIVACRRKSEQATACGWPLLSVTPRRFRAFALSAASRRVVDRGCLLRPPTFR